MVKRATVRRKPPVKKPTPTNPIMPAVEPTKIDLSKFPWLAIAVLVVGGYYVYTHKPVNPINPVTPPLVVSTELAKVVNASQDKAAVADCGRLYLAFADVASRAKPMSSAKLRAWVIGADTYMIQGTDRLGKIPGFAAAKDAEFASILGLEDRELTAADMQKFVTKCREIALACGVTDGK